MSLDQLDRHGPVEPREQQLSANRQKRLISAGLDDELDPWHRSNHRVDDRTLALQVAKVAAQQLTTLWPVRLDGLPRDPVSTGKDLDPVPLAGDHNLKGGLDSKRFLVLRLDERREVIRHFLARAGG